MLPMKRKCRVCGNQMEYLSYASKAADSLFIRYRCPNCGAEAKEVALMTLMMDNKKVLNDLDKLEEKASDFPWPEE